MRVVLNFSGLRVGGGRTDAINLLLTLPRIALDSQFLAIVPQSCGYEKVDLSANCSLHTIPVKTFNNAWRLYYDNFVLPKICSGFESDVLFTMCNNGPIKISGKHILMLRRPQMAYGEDELINAKVKVSFKLKFLCWYFQQSLKYADSLIVQTNTMKQLVEQRYQVDCSIHVVGKAVSKRIKTSYGGNLGAGQISAIAGNKASKKFLYLTKYYPHKNIELACEAMLAARNAGHDVCLFLTLDPVESDDCQALLQDIDYGRYRGAVHNIGAVDLADIATVYEQVDAVFMPTLLESYSATFLEAMAYDKPLLVSDRTFAREICGDAAIYFDPLSIDSMVDSIEHLEVKEDLVTQMIEIGKEQFKKYDLTWNEIASNYIRILEN